VVADVRIVGLDVVDLREEQGEPRQTTVTGADVNRAGARVLCRGERGLFACGLLEDLDDLAARHAEGSTGSYGPLDEGAAGDLALFITLRKWSFCHGGSPHSQV